MRLFGFLLFFVLAVSLEAQLYYGFKGNYSIPFVDSQEIKYDDADDFLIYRVNFIDQSVAPTISLYGYYRKDLIYFQSELIYRQVKSRFIADNYVDLTNITRIENIKITKSIDVPIIAGLRVDRFKLGFGPSFSFIISENKIFQDIELFEEQRSRVESGFGFYFGVVLYRLHVDLSYQYKFNGVGDYLYWRGAYKGFSQSVQFIDLGMAFIF